MLFVARYFVVLKCVIKIFSWSLNSKQYFTTANANAATTLNTVKGPHLHACLFEKRRGSDSFERTVDIVDDVAGSLERNYYHQLFKI